METSTTLYAVVGENKLLEGRFLDCQITHFHYRMRDCLFKGTLDNCLDWAQRKSYSYHFSLRRTTMLYGNSTLFSYQKD